MNEILDIAHRSQFHFEYYPGIPEKQSERRFTSFLRQRFAEYFNLMELAGFSLIAGIVAFLPAVFLAIQFSVPHDLKPLVLPPKIDGWVIANGASFLGGLSGAFVLIFKRYRTFDIYPSTYLQVAVALMAGTFAGGFLTMAWPTPQTTFLAFAAGFLTSINVNFLPRLLRQQFAKLTGTELPPEIPTDLSLVIKNSEAIESLNNISLFSVAEFSKTEAIRIYLNMSQPVGVINAGEKVTRTFLVDMKARNVERQPKKASSKTLVLCPRNVHGS